jgi:hypothetical protein
LTQSTLAFSFSSICFLYFLEQPNNRPSTSPTSHFQRLGTVPCLHRMQHKQWLVPTKNNWTSIFPRQSTEGHFYGETIGNVDPSI